MSIDVVNEKKLVHPWAGGLNSAQFGTLDIDLDGIDDLVIFDRTSNKLNTYLNTGSGYEYAPEYELLFPKGIEGWIIFADYNCNGKKDIFTHTIFGIKVYENVSTDKLEWKKDADPLYTTGTSGDFNLQVNVTDIPAIADIDNDGDLDILVYNFAVGGFIRHHKNFSMENTGKCGLKFTRVSMNWGEFEECECDTFAFEGKSCYDIDDPNGGRVMHAGGKSILLIDMKANNVKDLLMSQEDCSKLYYLENKGTPDHALMNDFDMSFPDSQFPAHFERFPAAFHEDINHDGLKDLLVSPNLPDDPFYTVDFKNSVWLYQNTGSNNNPGFSFIKKNFLQDEMIDEGWMAKPFFADFDGDGDQDMFIAANGFEGNGIYYGAISLFENTGTSVSPKFEKKTSDFLQLSTRQWVDIKPLFADINKDGAPDLIIPARSKGSNRAFIYYLLNINDTGSFEFNPNDIRQLNFDQYVPGDNIYFQDFNKNGELDIILGKVSGRIELYHNNGNNTSFTKVSAALAGITDNYTRRSPSLIVADLNGNNREELAVIDNSGILRIIENFDTDSPIEHTTTLYNSIAEKEDSTRFGYYNQLAVARLVNGEFPFLVIGSMQGGVYLLNYTGENTGGDPNRIKVRVYPNPVNASAVNDQSVVTIKASMDGRLDVISLLGQIIFSQHVMKDEKIFLDASVLSHGIYIVRASTSKKNSSATKLVVIK